MPWNVQCATEKQHNMNKEPDVVFYFPEYQPKGKYAAEHQVNQWCFRRGWLPKNQNELITTNGGSQAEIWGGRIEGRGYIALRFDLK